MGRTQRIVIAVGLGFLVLGLGLSGTAVQSEKVPAMVLPIPGEYDGHDSESGWVYFLRVQLADTKDPIEHQYFRFVIPYLTAIDVFSAILNKKNVRAVIGGHNKQE